MTATRPRGLGWVISSLAIGACSADDLAPSGEPLGAAPAPDTAAVCILEARPDRGTFHFEGPSWLLASAEGRGPMVLDLRVAEFVLPAVRTNTSARPPQSAVSAAVGYNLSERVGVTSFSRVPVDRGSFRRVDAYPTFQRTAFEIRDAACATVIGVGASYRPIGVLFKVTDAGDTLVSEVGVYSLTATGALVAGPAPPLAAAVAPDAGLPREDGGAPDGGAFDGGR